MENTNLRESAHDTDCPNGDLGNIGPNKADTDNKVVALRPRKFKVMVGPSANNKFFNAKELTWDDLIGVFADHRETERKDGLCFIPARWAGERRHATSVTHIEMLVYDIDGGMTVDQIAQILDKAGVKSIAYSTHSHMTNTTMIKVDNYDKWARRENQTEDPTPESMALYLESVKKGHLQNVEFDLERHHIEGGLHYLLKHDPIAKVRIVFPLEQPIEIGKLARTIKDCIEVWKSIYFGIAQHHGLNIDTSTSDPSRLYYLPSHQPGADYFAHGYPGDKVAQNAAPFMDWRKYRKAEIPNDRNASQNGKSQKPRDYFIVRDADGVDIDLKRWAKMKAADFDIEGCLQIHAPDLCGDSRASGSGCHVVCPFEDEHGTGGGQGTFCAPAEGDRGFTIFCTHNSCQSAERDRLDFLREYVLQGHLTARHIEYEAVDTAARGSNASFASDAESSRSTESQLNYRIKLRSLLESKGYSGRDDRCGGLVLSWDLDGILHDVTVRDASLLNYRSVAEGPLPVDDLVLRLTDGEPVPAEYLIGDSEITRLLHDLEDREKARKISADDFKRPNPLLLRPDDPFIETVLRLNSQYAFVLHKSDAFVYRESSGELLKPKAFSLDVKNNHFDFKGKKQRASEVWYEGAARRSYDRVGLFPNDMTNDGECFRDTFHAGALNLWRGFIYVPKPGECSLILDHIEKIFHQGCRQTMHWDLAWHAQMLVTPHLKQHTAIVRYGGAGAAKGLFGRMWRERVIGPYHSIQLTDTEHLVQKFNAHLARAIFVQGDEVSWGGNRRVRDKLFSLIGDDHLSHEAKGKDVDSMLSYHRVLLHSNDDRPVPIEGDDRRFAVFKTMPDEQMFGSADDPNALIKKRAYYNALDHELREGANAYVQHLLDFTKTAEYRAIDLRTPPMTQSKLDILLRNLKGEMAWILDVAIQGGFAGSDGAICCGGALGQDAESIMPKSLIYGSAEPHFRAHMSPRALGTVVGSFLEEHGFINGQKRVSPASLPGFAGAGDRVPHYVFPKLAEFRERVARYLKVPVGRLTPVEAETAAQPQARKVG